MIELPKAADRRRRAHVLAALFLLALPTTAPAQRKGEYLTDEEMDAVRVAQRIDFRSEVFVKIADRRLLAILDPAAKLTEKEIRIYGALPTGSQVDLLDDYRRTIDEFMEKIDDVYTRDGKSKQFVKAMEAAKLAVDRQLKELATLRPNLKSTEAVHFCDKAVESAKLLAEGIAGVLESGETKAP
jgi:hypothetical protein